eukprot:TRINITY_DN87858_c0_g1_i1.p1 TRINITY_DN87858_c0_g1~~TRINITY_DN87858_c0_g1_i1.p1  ORF type:complete len:1012 (+),score=166.49 TRINITY_DN87858_c0_g1_i1:77-3037(+)
MSDTSARVRAIATEWSLPEALRLGIAGAFGLLERALNDEKPVRRAAAGCLDIPAVVEHQNGEDAVRLMSVALDSKDNNVREIASKQGLGLLIKNRTDAVFLLEKALSDKDGKVRLTAAANALPEISQYRHGEVFIRLLRKVLHDKNVDVMTEGVQRALPKAFRCNCAEALQLLDEALDSSSMHLEQVAAEMAIPQALVCNATEGFLLLQKVMKDKNDPSDPSWEVRRDAVQFGLPIALRQNISGASELLEAALRDRHGLVRAAAVGFALPEVMHQRTEYAFQRLSEALNDGHDMEREMAAGQPLSEALVIDYDNASRMLVTAMYDDKPNVRTRAFEGLPVALKAKGMLVWPLLEKLMFDNQIDIRSRAVEIGLPEALRINLTAALPLLEKSLQDKSVSIVKKAASALSRINIQPAKEAALPFIETALKSKHADVREAAAGHLPDFWQKLGFQKITSLVGLALNDSDEMVRSAGNFVAKGEARAKANGAKIRLEAQKAAIKTEKARQRDLKFSNTVVNLSTEVRDILVRRGDSVCAPPGVMLLRVNGDLQAHRCLNDAACQGERCLPFQLQDTDDAKGAQCSAGYDDNIPGCGPCASDYGRDSSDPFKCFPCYHTYWVSWLRFILPPAGMYGVALAGATKAKDQFGHVLKICISFGTSASLIIKVLRYSPVIEEVQARFGSWLKPMMTGSLTAADTASGSMTQLGLECLLSNHDSGRIPLELTSLLAIRLSAPVMLSGVGMLCIIAFAVFKRCIQGDQDGFKILLTTFLVSINLFLPQILASLLMAAPCVQTQVDNKPMLAWDVHVGCADRPVWKLAVSVLFCLTIGPLCWAVLISRKDNAPAGSFDFLTSAYKHKRQYWEVVVLLRRMAICAVGTLFPLSYSPLAQILFSSTIMFAALVAHVMFRPFEDSVLNSIEFLSLVTSAFSMSISTYVVSDAWSSTPSSRFYVFILCMMMLGFTSTVLMGLLARLKLVPKDLQMARMSIVS